MYRVIRVLEYSAPSAETLLKHLAQRYIRENSRYMGGGLIITEAISLPFDIGSPMHHMRIAPFEESTRPDAEREVNNDG